MDRSAVEMEVRERAEWNRVVIVFYNGNVRTGEMAEQLTTAVMELFAIGKSRTAMMVIVWQSRCVLFWAFDAEVYIVTEHNNKERELAGAKLA